MLTLQVTGPQAASVPVKRHSFSSAGGVIGRARSSDWVLPNGKVSGRHASITCLDGTFYIEDTSTNGVFINSPSNRLVAGRRYALRQGDRILIEPYEIEVAVSTAEASALDVLSIEDASAPPAPRQVPLPRQPPLMPERPSDLVPEPVPSEEVDPLKLLGGAPKAPAPKQVPTADELQHASMLSDHYRPPAIVPPPTPAAQPPAPQPAAPFVIPADYDPLRDDFTEPEPAIPVPGAPPPSEAPWTPPPAAGSPAANWPPEPFDVVPAEPLRPTVSPVVPVAAATPTPSPAEPVPTPPAMLSPAMPAAMPASAAPAPAPALGAPPAPAIVSSPPGPPVAVPAADVASADAPPIAAPAPPSIGVEAPAPLAAQEMPPSRRQEPVPSVAPADSDAALAALLSGAGLSNVKPTPELARAFGEIFRVVVTGVMDVLQSRQQVKDEFRMRMTQFRPVDNNPLKFSANVDDALHNLLVKRNPAYLGPVDAFEDAFEDLRNHQLAVLAGMRVAFEALLAAFDPDQLEKQFDRQMKRAPLLRSLARLHYWDLYRDRRDEMAKDPDATFKTLFGDQFARAYEEQLKRLKAEHRAKATDDETRCL